MVRGIGRSLRYLAGADADEVAVQVQPYFPDLSVESLARIVTNLRGVGLWATTPVFPVDAFVRLKAALLSGGLISYDVPYDLAVDEELSATPIPQE